MIRRCLSTENKRFTLPHFLCNIQRRFDVVQKRNINQRLFAPVLIRYTMCSIGHFSFSFEIFVCFFLLHRNDKNKSSSCFQRLVVFNVSTFLLILFTLIMSHSVFIYTTIMSCYCYRLVVFQNYYTTMRGSLRYAEQGPSSFEKDVDR